MCICSSQSCSEKVFEARLVQMLPYVIRASECPSGMTTYYNPSSKCRLHLLTHALSLICHLFPLSLFPISISPFLLSHIKSTTHPCLIITSTVTDKDLKQRLWLILDAYVVSVMCRLFVVVWQCSIFDRCLLSDPRSEGYVISQAICSSRQSLVCLRVCMCLCLNKNSHLWSTTGQHAQCH